MTIVVECFECGEPLYLQSLSFRVVVTPGTDTRYYCPEHGPSDDEIEGVDFK